MSEARSTRNEVTHVFRKVFGAEACLTRPETLQINLVQELGSDSVGGTIREEYPIGPSNAPTIVSVASHVVTETARKAGSPEYLASVRRRKSRRIINMLSSLDKKTRRSDFDVFTFRIMEEIRELLVQLADVQHEGNTREILRQVRDTFLDGRDESYRDPKARDVVASIFQRLSDADEVTPADVDQVWDELYRNDLAAPIPLVVTVGEGKEEVDG
jgi:hypothetical protein